MNYVTKAIHGGNADESKIHPVNEPIYLSSTFLQPGFDEFQSYVYSRGSNPTRSAVEQVVAELEEAKYAFACASGMAATTLAFSLVHTGEKVLVTNNVYGGTYRYVSSLFERQGISYELVDDMNAVDFDLLDEKVSTIFIETPSNPLLDITDIQSICEKAHKRKIRVIVDNTFLTSYFQKPLTLGADIVVYSATKFYAGHSDILAGLVVVNDESLYQQLKFSQNTLGSILSPFDSFLLLRGIKTLGLRMERHNSNAEQIATYLQQHEGMKQVYYPGLKEHTGYEIHKRQSTGNGAIVSIRLSEDYDQKRFVEHLRIFGIAVSLGGVESLICHPATMTHESYPRELQEKLGIEASLLRLAIGIEDIEDLLNDLEQALEQARK